MTIKEFHDSLRALANIGQSQYFPPEDIDLQINTAVDKMFKQEYKHFEATQEITDTLGYYKSKSPTPVVLDTKGEGDLPSNFYHLSEVEAILTDDTRVRCEILTDAEWLIRKHSKGFAPTKDRPVGRQIGTSKFEVSPFGTNGVKSVILLYLRQPNTAKFAYSVNQDGTSWTYDQSNSVQVDWPRVGHPQIQDKALGLIGVTLRDRVLIGNETISKNQNEGA